MPDKIACQSVHNIFLNNKACIGMNKDAKGNADANKHVGCVENQGGGGQPQIEWLHQQQHHTDGPLSVPC